MGQALTDVTRHLGESGAWPTDGEPIEGLAMLLSELLTQYVESNPSIKSVHTERLFAIVLRHFDRFLSRAATVDDLSDRLFCAYARSRRNAGLAETTIENESKRLLVLWRYAAREGFLPMPKIRLHAVKPAAPRAPSPREVRRLFRAAIKSQRTIKGQPVCLLYPALMGVVWNTIERIAAVRAVHRSRIDLRRRRVTYIAGTRKGGGPTVVKPITRSTARALRRWLDHYPGEYPFQHCRLTSLYHHFNEIVKEAGVDPEDCRGFHALRKAGATEAKRRGGDIRFHLGHADERTGIRHYVVDSLLGHRPLTKLLFDPLGWWGRILAAMGL